MVVVLLIERIVVRRLILRTLILYFSWVFVKTKSKCKSRSTGNPGKKNKCWLTVFRSEERADIAIDLPFSLSQSVFPPRSTQPTGTRSRAKAACKLIRRIFYYYSQQHTASTSTESGKAQHQQSSIMYVLSPREKVGRRASRRFNSPHHQTTAAPAFPSSLSRLPPRSLCGTFARSSTCAGFAFSNDSHATCMHLVQSFLSHDFSASFVSLESCFTLSLSDGTMYQCETEEFI